MTREGFSPEVHRYLDGESVEGIAGGDRAAADRLSEAVASYADGLEVPGPEVDRAVMAVILSRQTPARQRSLWRWFVEPRMVRVRPALAAAVAIAVIATSSLVTILGIGNERSAQTVASGGASQQTVLVRFELLAPEAGRVALAGSFNDWNATGVQLTKNSATGVWTVTVPLVPGEHQYLFLLDDERWIPDPTAHALVDDGFGQRNSVIAVGPRGVVRS